MYSVALSRIIGHKLQDSSFDGSYRMEAAIFAMQTDQEQDQQTGDARFCRKGQDLGHMLLDSGIAASNGTRQKMHLKAR